MGYKKTSTTKRGRKQDRRRLSDSSHERRYMAKECKDFLAECKRKNRPRLISNEITLNTVKKLARYYLRFYKKYN